MTEWGVFGVLAGLAAFIGLLVKPMLSLNSSITKLTVMMEQFSGDLGELTQKNSDNHQRLWAKNAEQDTRINRHEARISVLEDRIE